ncbi:UTP--glucose-1-phosphate uridylyltransferase [Candidatus Saccharibacteria bacterium]|nr:UTP--glucose-1-phosphate uridylyltransferase [Candidatus Saccharibacteria bacterium]
MNYKAPKKAVITDAGFASRFLPITKTIPKGMLPIGNRPVIQLVIEECLSAGIEEIILVVTPEGKTIYEDYFNNPAEKAKKQLYSQGKQDRFASVERVLNFPKITIITQDPSLPYGNGSPIASAKGLIDPDEAFIAIYSDDVVYGQSAVKDLMDAFEKHSDARAIIGCQLVPHEEIKKYAAVDYDSNTEVLHGLVEKPAPEDAASDLASYGRYLLTPEIFTHLIPENTGKDDELWLAEAIAKLIPTGQVYAKQTNGLWMTTGDPANYTLAQLKYTLDNEPYAADVREFIKNN